MLDRRTLIGALALGSAGGLRARAAPAFPTRDVTFVVPWNAGGSVDILTRRLQPLLKERGLSIIVENQPGANGTIGLGHVAAANPDGYTLGLATSSLLAYQVQGKTNLENSQFAHIALIAFDPLVLLVPSTSPHKTLDQFLDHMRKNPGAVSIGTPGNQNVNHVFASMTAQIAGVKYINVPYTGGSRVVADLAGGQIEAGVLRPSESIGQIQENLVRPLALFADERVDLLPDVPTFKELGYDVFPYGPVVQMAYIVAPAKVSPEIRTKLIEVFSAAIQDERFKSFAEQNASMVTDLTGDALATEVEKIKSAIKSVAEKVFKN